jgi:hypothetical protein
MLCCPIGYGREMPMEKQKILHHRLGNYAFRYDIIITAMAIQLSICQQLATSSGPSVHRSYL